MVAAYSADLNRRWAELDRVLWSMLVEDDILGLGDRPPRVVLQIRPPRRFDFPVDVPGKADAFDAWLRGALDTGVLEIIGGRPTGWQNAYVRAGYSRGVEHADRMLRQVGLEPEEGALAQTFNQPIHVSKLQLLYSRNFRALRGITDATGQSLSRIITDGLARGRGPREVAREIRKAVSTIGRNRSLVMARTEIMYAHQEATLNRFQQAGVEEVVGRAELLTAQDERVCQQCLSLEGTTYKIDEARGLIPVHPQCRCCWLPVLT